MIKSSNCERAFDVGADGGADVGEVSWRYELLCRGEMSVTSAAWR